MKNHYSNLGTYLIYWGIALTQLGIGLSAAPRGGVLAVFPRVAVLVALYPALRMPMRVDFLEEELLLTYILVSRHVRWDDVTAVERRVRTFRGDPHYSYRVCWEDPSGKALAVSLPDTDLTSHWLSRCCGEKIVFCDR